MIHIENINIHIHPEHQAITASEPQQGIPAEKPAIGQYWPGQGGIYAGDFLGGNGVIYGLIVADCGLAQDIGDASWGRYGSLAQSDWDGLGNTKALISADSPAATLAAEYTHDGYTDFYLPARRELLLAAANLYDRFGKGCWYWTSTQGGENNALSVYVDYCYVEDRIRDNVFRVLPFRRFFYPVASTQI